MSHTGIHIPQKKFQRFCFRYRVRQMVLFSESVFDCFHPYGSVDVMVAFYPSPHTPFYKLNRMENELTVLFRCPVDIVSLEGMTLTVRDDSHEKMTEVYAA